MTYKLNKNQLINFEVHNSLSWLNNSILYLAEHGSQAYGLATPESDLDIKGICCPPKQYFLSPFSNFEQAEGKNETCEYVIYDIKKFIELAADCNPNIIEVLWVDESSIIEINEMGRLLRDNKEMFMSSKAKHTFSGYAMAQLKRIKTHKKWLLNPPSPPPTRESLGLPSYDEVPKAKLDMLLADIKKKVDQWNIGLDELSMSERIRIQERVAQALAEMQLGKDEQWLSAARILCLSESVINILDKERHYQNARHEYEQYNNWKSSRNAKRAALEAKFGYDCKHASHLVRLMRMCEEILTTGKVNVRRPDREEILAVKNGKLTYEELIEYADTQDKKLTEIYKTTKLKHSPDRKAIEELCIRIVEESLKQGESND
jgi:predicted nucleotidyltransferase